MSQVKLLISSPENSRHFFSPKLLIGFSGVVLIILGFIFGNKILSGNSKVEVLQTPSSNISLSKEISNTNTIAVDVGGAVVHPGVYYLSVGDRVEDAIIASGGLSENADKNWVDKNLNKAAKLIDGQKLYLPLQQSGVLGASNSTSSTYVAQSSNTSDSNLVNINTATLSELDGLPGIGQVYAQKIVDQRPYSDVSELVSKKAVTQSIFEKIKDKISVY